MFERKIGRKGEIQTTEFNKTCIETILFTSLLYIVHLLLFQLCVIQRRIGLTILQLILMGSPLNSAAVSSVANFAALG